MRSEGFVPHSEVRIPSWTRYTPRVPAISVTVITFNAAAQLEPAIESVAWADEIIVVDSGSTDGTLDLARRLATRVEMRQWPGYAAQKNHAASLAANEWILSIDADERVSPGLAGWLQRWRSTDPQVGGYRIPRVSWYLDRWIRTTDWYPDLQLRLYHRGRGQWTSSRVHESVRVDGPVAVAGGELQHYPYAGVSEHLQRIDRYTTLAAMDMRDRGVRATSAALIIYPVAAFLRNYVLRGGIRDGRTGLAVSLLNTYYVMLKFVKLLELETGSQSRG
jgi:glycosyltransferase involved in cell wall biosynthesis